MKNSEQAVKTNFGLVYDFNKVFQRSQLEALEVFNEGSEREKLDSQIELMDEELQEIKDAIEEGDWEALKDGVIDLLVVTYGLGYVMNIDCDKGLQEVNRANMSKLCSSQQEVVATTGYYNSIGVECSVQLVDENLWVVKSTKDQKDMNDKFYPKGKFLKNVNWSEPDLFGIEK